VRKNLKNEHWTTHCRERFDVACGWLYMGIIDCDFGFSLIWAYFSCDRAYLPIKDLKEASINKSRSSKCHPVTRWNIFSFPETLSSSLSLGHAIKSQILPKFRIVSNFYFVWAKIVVFDWNFWGVKRFFNVIPAKKTLMVKPV